MKTAATIVTLLTAATSLFAQALPSPFNTARSLSGQFLVFASRAPALRPALGAATNGNWVSLEPTLVTVSAERIKQAVWRELGVTGSWQNKISITLHPARSGDEPVNIVSDHSQGVWNYRVAMPDQMVRERYLRAIVQVVLLELANRAAREQPAEIPAWLTEGLTYQLLAGHGADLVINTPRLSLNGVTYNPPVTTDARPISSLEKAHKIMLGDTPLTFEELSWPAPGQMDGGDVVRFGKSYLHRQISFAQAAVVVVRRPAASFDWGAADDRIRGHAAFDRRGVDIRFVGRACLTQSLRRVVKFTSVKLVTADLGDDLAIVRIYADQGGLNVRHLL